MAGLWEIVVPQVGVNLSGNPSGETNLTGYTTGAGSLSRSQAATRWGQYSIAYTPGAATSDGFYYTTSTLSNGQAYTFSVYVKGVNGVPYKIYFADNTGVLVGSAYIFTGDGTWHRYSVTYTAAASATHRLYITKNGSASTTIFYTDGWMLTTGSDLHTYIDGDQPGCTWGGTKHASTSTRSAEWRQGGKIVNLDAYSAYILSAQGYGMPPIENVALDYGLLPGALYQRTRVKPRLLTLVAQAMGTSLANLHAVRDALIGITEPDATSVQMPFLLRYLGGNKTRILKALLDDGLGGGELEGFNEKLGLRLIAHDPFFYQDGETSATLQQGTITANNIAQRAPSGAWSGLGGGLTVGAVGAVYAIAYDRTNNCYYVGGDFTIAGGGAANNIAKYDVATATWSALGTGCNGNVYTIVVDPTNGDVYVGGTFTSAGGVANTSRVAKWNGSAWSALATGLSSDVQALAFDSDHNLWATGDFSGRISKWNGSAWSGLGTGLNGRGLALLLGPDRNMYVAGQFTTANGVSAKGVAYWNGTTFVALGGGLTFTGLDGIGYSLALGLDGIIYVGGSFTDADSVPCNNIAAWNGTNFSPLGSGLANIPRALIVTPDGVLHAGGLFTTAGGYALPDPLAKWNGSNWFLHDIDLPGASPTLTVWALVVAPDGTLTVGFDTEGTAKVGSVATVTNDGTAPAYPRMVITGPSSGTSVLYSLINYTTNDSIFFTSGLTIRAGETMVLDLTPGGKSFTSNFQGDLISKIQPGSNIGTWRLKKGNNSVVFLTADATVAASLIWTERFWSADGGAA
jgi:hypothetical protein